MVANALKEHELDGVLTMKRLIVLALLSSTLGGCIVAPVEPGYYGRPRYVEPAPVVVVPSYRGPRGYDWDGDRGRGWGHGRRW